MFQTSTFRLQACCRSFYHWKLPIRTEAVFVASSIWRHASGLLSWSAVDTTQPHRHLTRCSHLRQRANYRSSSFYPLSFITFFFQKCHYLPAQMLSGSVKLRPASSSCYKNYVLWTELQFYSWVKRKPTWCHLFYYLFNTHSVLNMFRPLIRPSSGVCD